MSDCSQHKKELFGETDMKKVAEIIGDMHYEALAELIARIGLKLYKDGLKDRLNQRELLGYSLTDASDKMIEAANFIEKAWKISKPYMQS